MSHVFVSHSHEDKASADLIVAALEKRGVKCWVAPRDVPPGGSYAEAILNAIQNASSVVLIYSERSNVSPHVLREVERALNFGVNIIPIRFDRSTPSKSLDYLLATVQWLSIEEPVAGAIGKAAEQIAAAVAIQLQSKLGAVASPQPTAPAATPPPPRKNFGLMVGVGVLLVAIIVAALLFFRKSSAPPVVAKQTQSSTSPTAAPVATPWTITGPVEILAPPSTPTSAELAVDEDTKQNITDFVKTFLHDQSSDDVKQRVSYFADPCHYYSNPKASADEIRRDVEHEIAESPERTNMAPMGFKIAKVNDYEYTVSFSFIYSNQGPKAHSSGIRNLRLTLKPSGTSYRIAAISKSDLK